jgi:threonine/homoserine/homoserine lactone efflux protein
MIVYLLQGITLGLSAAATPGPFQAFVIGQALKNGWRRTLPAAFAPLLSDGPVILLMVLLLTSLPTGVLRAIQIAGGVYVLYLAWNALMAYRHFQTSVPADGSGKTILQAAGMTLLSPGLYIYWSMLAGPILVRGWRESPSHGVVFLLGFYVAMVSAMMLLIVLFGAARQLGPRANRALLGFSALALFGFGLYQLGRGLLGV